VVPCELSIQFLFHVENIFNIILPTMQPGYGASVVDFHITKSEFVKDKIVRIAQIVLICSTGAIECVLGMQMNCQLGLYFK